MYDPDYIANFYDDYGEREWNRLESTPADRVNFHVHRYYLEQNIKPGDHVLDIGAGPGRFSIELVRFGAIVTAADISPGQLDLHRIKVAEAGCEHGIVDRQVLDIIDLSTFPDGCFDAVVCYGGPLSYALDRFDDALTELLRVTRSGGRVFFSVMSLFGSMRAFLPWVVTMMDESGVEGIQKIIDFGDLTDGHRCRMYRWSRLQDLLVKHSCTIEAASAANFLVLRNEEIIEQFADDPMLWERFLSWEIEACRQPGAIDGGTHIIVMLQRTSAADYSSIHRT